MKSERKAAPNQLSRRVRKQYAADVHKRGLPTADADACLAWFDGSAHPNPGRISIGAVIQSPDGQLLEISAAAGYGDSNEAEFLALITVLEAALRMQPKRLLVYGDSRVVIDDSNTGSSHASHLSDYCARVQVLLARFEQVSLIWLPRHKNAAADALSQAARHPVISTV